VKTFAPSPFTRWRAASEGPAPGAHSPGVGQALDFQRLILPHLDGAYNLARFLTRDPVLSEDVVQDALLRAYRSFAQFRGGSPRAWLLAIVRNCCRTGLAGAAGAISLVADSGSSLDEQADPAPNPEQEALRKSEIDGVRAAVEAIPEPFREVVVLRDLEELSYAEIAQVTGAPVGTVMSRLSRGRSMLAKQLLPTQTTSDEQSRSFK
jgi:RNA polymerase sigma factor (sigma-70 family)